jgi:magnesium transporter
MPPAADAILNDPVSRHARSDVASVRPEWTTDEALAHMRANPPGGRVVYFYATDADGRLVGVVPTRRLLLAAADARIADVMIRSVVALPADATVLEACEFFTMYRLLALPVVDDGRRLVGVVDVELYTDELAGLTSDRPAAERDDVFQLIGVHLAAAAQTQPLKAFRGRFPWLLCNVGGGLLAAVLSGVYQDVLEWNKAVLALFVPVVLTLAESVSIQSVTLALEGMRAGTPSWRRLAGRLTAELGTGGLLGAGTAAIVGAVAAVWQRDARVVGIVFAGILAGVTAAAMIGVSVPILLRLLKRDPQVAAGPIALAAADFVTLLIYFNVGRLAA